MSSEPRPSPDFFEQLLESAPDGIVVVDAHGTIRLVNRQAESLFGWQRGELVGQEVEVLVPQRVRKAHPGHRAQYFGDRRVRPMAAGLELTAARRDGTEFPVDISLSPLVVDEETFVAAAVRDATERKRAEQELRETNERLLSSVRTLERQGWELALINEMGDMLQSCFTEDEADRVIGAFTAKLFPNTPGVVLRPAPDTGGLAEVAAWGTAPHRVLTLNAHECWALRRGKLHAVLDEAASLRCGHLLDRRPFRSLCVPLMGQGEALGLLHLNLGAPGSRAPDVEATMLLAAAVAEHLSLALANLKLRESLRAASVRDPLTGLYNRRHMEEALEREVLRANRQKTAVAVLALDIDNFKTYNDTHGHAAGDAAIKAIAEILVEATRAEDVVCRQGGDEMLIILPNAGLAVARRRGEDIRQAAERVAVERFDQLTVSLGVAVFPDHAPSSMALLRAADAALYDAKAMGRNTISVASGAERHATHAVSQPEGETQLVIDLAQAARSAATPGQYLSELHLDKGI